MQLRWISVAEGCRVGDPAQIGPGLIDLTTPASGGWLATVTPE